MIQIYINLKLCQSKKTLTKFAGTALSKFKLNHEKENKFIQQ
jgi:hypothetical protein